MFRGRVPAAGMQLLDELHSKIQGLKTETNFGGKEILIAYLISIKYVNKQDILL